MAGSMADRSRIGSLGRVSVFSISYLLIFLCSLLLRVGGLGLVLRVSRSWPLSPRRQSSTLATPVVELVDASARWFPRRADCVQRSVVAFWVLRWYGIPAALVVGIRRVPFAAHAWVEMAGQVLNDSPERIAQYLPIESVAA